MPNPQTEAGATASPPRTELIADAALSVLAGKGARGLTHRATDEAAGLPQGSTSNYFRTRDSLLEAALQRHLELDLGPAGDGPPGDLGPLSPEQARRAILAAIDHVLAPGGESLIIARYELFLESTRRPALHAQVSEAREQFVLLATSVLRASGCPTPQRHAAQLIACLDGLTLDRVLAADSGLDRDDIAEVVDRLLSDC